MSTVEDKRRQLQRLYVDLIDRTTIGHVHRWLSEALVAHRRTAKAKKPSTPKRERKPGASSIVWHGRTLALGPAMRKCSARGQLFVLHYVHDGLGNAAAGRAAGYTKGLDISAPIKRAIAEERERRI